MNAELPRFGDVKSQQKVSMNADDYGPPLDPPVVDEATWQAENAAYEKGRSDGFNNYGVDQSYMGGFLEDAYASGYEEGFEEFQYEEAYTAEHIDWVPDPEEIWYPEPEDWNDTDHYGS